MKELTTLVARSFLLNQRKIKLCLKKQTFSSLSSLTAQPKWLASPPLQHVIFIHSE
ncbi:hypothetical protein N9496_01575 [Akkermansiaceae bacterium]|nr:hypothetical protein [Akkermansiaceae bacterium]